MKWSITPAEKEDGIPVRWDITVDGETINVSEKQWVRLNEALQPLMYQSHWAQMCAQHKRINEESL